MRPAGTLLDDLPRAARPVVLPRPGPGAKPRAAESAIPGVVLRAGVVIVLAAAPLAFGATPVYAAAALVGAAWLLLLSWLAIGIVAGKLEVPSHPAALPALLLLALTMVHWLSGISVSPVATRVEWQRWTAYVSLALVAIAAFDTPRRLRILFSALAAMGAAVAVLGIVQYLTSDGKIYWIVEPQYGGWAFGPYVNRNHFAGLMELWMPLALGLAFLPESSLTRRGLWAAAAIVMCTALVLSGSRGGVLAMLLQFGFLILLAVAARGGRRAVAVLLLVAVIAVGAALAFDQGRAFGRFLAGTNTAGSLDSEVAGNRIAAWRGTLTIFRQNWIIGSGLETFPVLFPAVRSFATDKFWSHAHNDILQFLAEAGVAGAALVVWMIAASLRPILSRLRSAADPAGAVMTAALVCACVGFLVHGWLDFNFHVPANAASFAVLAALLGCPAAKEA